MNVQRLVSRCRLGWPPRASPSTITTHQLARTLQTERADSRGSDDRQQAEDRAERNRARGGRQFLCTARRADCYRFGLFATHRHPLLRRRSPPVGSLLDTRIGVRKPAAFDSADTGTGTGRRLARRRFAGGGVAYGPGPICRGHLIVCRHPAFFRQHLCAGATGNAQCLILRVDELLADFLTRVVPELYRRRGARTGLTERHHCVAGDFLALCGYEQPLSELLHLVFREHLNDVARSSVGDSEHVGPGFELHTRELDRRAECHDGSVAGVGMLRGQIREDSEQRQNHRGGNYSQTFHPLSSSFGTQRSLAMCRARPLGAGIVSRITRCGASCVPSRAQPYGSTAVSRQGASRNFSESSRREDRSSSQVESPTSSAIERSPSLHNTSAPLLRQCFRVVTVLARSQSR